MAKAKVTFTVKFGEVVFAGLTMAQASRASRQHGYGCPAVIVGSDGLEYVRAGTKLVPAGAKTQLTPEQQARLVAARAADMERRPLPDDGAYDDDAAIEDLGLGTRDGGLFRGKK